MDDLRNVWGRRIAAARKEAGITQYDLARAAALSPSTISAIEQGQRGCGDAVRVRIAVALGANVNELFAYPVEEPAA